MKARRMPSRDANTQGPYLLVLVGMSVLFFWSILFKDQVPLLGDLCHLFYPGYVFHKASLLNGHLPLWNPYLGCGEPFLASIERGVFYPPNLLYIILPETRALSVVIALHVFIAGAGTFALCRQWRISSTGALLAATTYAFSSYTITKIEFPSELGNAAWFPVVFAGFSSWLSRRHWRSFLLLVASLAMACLAGFPEAFVFGLSMIGLYALLAGYVEWRRQGGLGRLFIPLLGLGAAGALAMCLSAAQLLPTCEALSLSVRSTAADPRLASHSIHPLAAFSFLVPSVYGVGVQGEPGAYWAPTCGDYSVGALYVGVIPVVVCLAALVRRIFGDAPREASPPERSMSGGLIVTFLAAVALLFFLYSLGLHTPIYAICRQAVPLLHYFVSPPKCLLVVTLSLAVLAAIGIDYCAGCNASRLPSVSNGRRRIIACVPVAFFAAVGVFIGLCLIRNGQLGETLLRSAFNLDSVEPRFADRIPWDILLRDSIKLPVVGLLGATLLLVHGRAVRWRKVTGGAIVAIAFIDLLVTNTYQIQPGDAAVLRERSRFVEAVRPEGSPTRFCAFEHFYAAPIRKRIDHLPPGRTTLDLELADPDEQGYGMEEGLHRALHDIFHSSWPVAEQVWNVHSSNNFLPQCMGRLVGAATSAETPVGVKRKLLAMLNCERILLPPEPVSLFVDTMRPSPRLAILDPPLPRAFVVRGVEFLPTQAEVWKRLTSAEFDPLTVALMQSGTGMSTDVEGLQPGRVRHEITRIEYGANRLMIEVVSASAGLLVVSDSYFPGWRATVNGEKTPIHQVNRALRGLRVPAGKSTVIMRYRPLSLRIGVIVSLAALIVMCVLFVPSPKPPSRSTPSEDETSAHNASPSPNRHR